MSNNRVKIIYGAYPIPFIPKDQLSEVLHVLEKYNVKDLDTARVYPDGEKSIGKLNLPAKYTIHTKAVTFQDGALSKDSIVAVSYTHLDVYKRQLLTPVFGSNCSKDLMLCVSGSSLENFDRSSERLSSLKQATSYVFIIALLGH